MKKVYLIAIAVLILVLLAFAACAEWGDHSNVVLRFSPYTQESFTKASPAECFEKLNIMLFNQAGEKVFDKVKTQTTEDDNFGTLSLQLTPGTYKVVAVGHSSKVSATIKSPEAVQFTAKDGEKLTDTFNYCGDIVVTEEKQEKILQMKRVAAMFRLKLKDEELPASFAKMKFDYTGGSANYNPTTGQGITKSTQAENRLRSDSNVYEIYTFPYLSETGTLQITASALDGAGNVLIKHTFKDVPMRVNTITSYEGEFFGDMPGEVTATTVGFTVDPAWATTNTYTF